MTAKTKLGLQLFAILVLSFAIASVARNGFAWTSPVSNPPLGTNVINVSNTNVGIGMTPSQKLDVNGYVRGTGMCIGASCITAWPNGTVASIATNNGLTGGTITTSGTIGLDTTSLSAGSAATGKVYWDGARLISGTDQTGSGGVTGSGYGNYLAKWSSGNALTYSPMYESGGALYPNQPIYGQGAVFSSIVIGTGGASIAGNLNISGNFAGLNLNASQDIYMNSGMLHGGGGYILSLQNDGNLVWYTPWGSALWNSKNPTVAGSDRRLKDNIKILDSTDALRKIEQLDGVSFEWKSDGRKDMGLIAQDVEKVYPELVFTDKDAKKMKRLEYGGLIAPMIQAIKEQQKIIESQDERIKRLEGILR